MSLAQLAGQSHVNVAFGLQLNFAEADQLFRAAGPKLLVGAEN
jgi:hypothetical protein